MTEQNFTDEDIKRIANKAGINYVPYPELGYSEEIFIDSRNIGDLIRDCIKEYKAMNRTALSLVIDDVKELKRDVASLKLIINS